MEDTDIKIPVVEVYPGTEDDTDSNGRQIVSRLELKPWLFQPGVVQNPGGKPKGPTLKHFAREYLASMTLEERLEFMRGMPKETIWKMSEGNPSEDKNIKISVPQPILGGITQHNTELLGDNTQPS